MAIIDKEYHDLLSKIVNEGYQYEDPNRKGVCRLEIPSYTFRHEMKDGFPAITTKKLSYHNVVTELIWFLRGDTNIKYLLDNNCNIWNKDAYNYYKEIMVESKKEVLPIDEFINKTKNDVRREKPSYYEFGDLGPIYGRQWRNSSGFDQIIDLIKNMTNKPMSTELIVNSWNIRHLNMMALPPCHYSFQVICRPLKKGYGFELHWSQRSVDTFLGLPYNIASYATLGLLLEEITGYKLLAIQGDLKNVHLYENSLGAVVEQLERNSDFYGTCKLDIQNLGAQFYENIDLFINSLKIKDFVLEGYESYPALNVPMLGRD